jgi:uncharacterized membrane protein (DUF373 family)
MDDLHVPREPLIQSLRFVIRAAVRALAILMTLVILLGVVDVAYVLYRKLTAPPFLMLTINDILATFGAFMGVLIAIEIFVNIIIYLREDVIHVKIVIATALMAIARKVIIFDYERTEASYVWATAGVTLAMGVSYWLVHYLGRNDSTSPAPSKAPATARDTTKAAVSENKTVNPAPTD